MEFEAHRAHLRAVAYRMLGSESDADDAVQEAWLRLDRAGTDGVDNLRAWLTTMVARVCLDVLRSRQVRGRATVAERAPRPEPELGPEDAAVMADSLGVALLVVLETLDPAARVAFVLHDLFGVPIDEIAAVVGRTPGATRQLASRGRRRVQGAGAIHDDDRARRRVVVEAFLAASREGNFDALLSVLDPDVVLRADASAVAAAAKRRAMGAPALEPEIHGARAVAGIMSGTARAAQVALLDGAYGAVWAPKGRAHGAFLFTIEHEKIVAVEIIGDPTRLAELDVIIVND